MPLDDDHVSWSTLARYWSSGPELPVERAIKVAILLCRIVSLSNCKLRVAGALRMRPGTVMDLYISCWALGLSAVLFLGGHPGNYWAAAAAGYWVFESNAYRLYFLLIKSVNRPWSAEGVRRSVLLGMMSLYVVVVAFAILYLTIGSVVFEGKVPVPAATPAVPCVAGTTNNVGGERVQILPITPIRALYYSAVTMTLLGYGDFLPDNDRSRVIVMAQLFTAVLLIMFIVPALMSVYSSSLRVAENSKEKVVGASPGKPAGDSGAE